MPRKNNPASERAAAPAIAPDGDHRISVKRHHYTDGRVVAACDEELLGQKFREGKLRLDVARSFYDGEYVDEGTFLEVISMAAIVNLVGERAVAAAIGAGILDETGVIRIAGVPHAQIVQLGA